jgi:hypothetical protein
MRLQNIFKSSIGIFVILTAVSCAENPNNTPSNKTPYDSFTKVIRAFGGGQRGLNVRGERSPLIHKDIYARADKDKLIYFYQGRDAHNVNFTRTLKDYADKAWLRVEAYTLDNRTLMEFPDTCIATAEIIAKYFGDEYFGNKKERFKTPVLFLEQFDAHTAPVSVGEISFMQLVNKMNWIAENRSK